MGREERKGNAVGIYEEVNPYLSLDEEFARARKEDMIVITGAYGFVGSNLTKELWSRGYRNLVLVDNLGNPPVFTLPEALLRVPRGEFIKWLEKRGRDIEFVFHLGAKSHPLERSFSDLYDWNLMFSRRLFEACVRESVPFVYASTSATYGHGKERGFSDDEAFLSDLEPLTAYATYKHDFDKWVLSQKERPFFWVGLKFFNVYGPAEERKGEYASMVYKMHEQIQARGVVDIYEPADPRYSEGRQARDFVHVADVVNVCCHFMEKRFASGIYNVGTGQSTTYKDLASLLFRSLGKEERIRYVPIPEKVAQGYQLNVCADIEKLRKRARYDKAFLTLSEGVQKYAPYLRDQLTGSSPKSTVS